MRTPSAQCRAWHKANSVNWPIFTNINPVVAVIDVTMTIITNNALFLYAEEKYEG